MKPLILKPFLLVWNTFLNSKYLYFQNPLVGLEVLYVHLLQVYQFYLKKNVTLLATGYEMILDYFQIVAWREEEVTTLLFVTTVFINSVFSQTNCNIYLKVFILEIELW